MSFELREDYGIIDFLNDVDRGAHLLPEFLKNAVNVQGIINAIIPEIQELHDAQSDIYSTINIFEAVGLQLDEIFGAILDLERESGQSDADYRADLLVAVATFARSGEITVVKSIYKSILQASKVSLYEYQPHEFRMFAQVASVQQNNPFRLTEGPSQIGSPFGLSDGVSTGGFLIDDQATVADEIQEKLDKAAQSLKEAKQGGVKMSLTVNTKTAFMLTGSTPQLNSPNGLTDGTFIGGTLSAIV